MRTTISIDDHLLDRVRRRAAELSQTVSQVIEDSVRETLARRQDPAPPTFRLRPFRGGAARFGVDLDDNARLLDLMDARGVIACDVNVLVYAFNADAREHADYRVWLEEAANGAEPFGLPSIVASGFVRVVTHPRVLSRPLPSRDALDLIEELRAAPAVIPLEPGPRHWPLFVELCRAVGAKGNAVPDTHLAALALEHGATWYSADRGFARFPGLRTRHPLASASS